MCFTWLPMFGRIDCRPDDRPNDRLLQYIIIVPLIPDFLLSERHYS